MTQPFRRLGRKLTRYPGVSTPIRALAKPRRAVLGGGASTLANRAATASTDNDAREAMVDAVATASNAPSVHNTQPWHWRVRGRVAELHAVPQRQLHVTDPDRHLLLLSCGSALHHLRVALAAAGWDVLITRFPDRSNHDLLAKIEIRERSIPAMAAVRQCHAITLRYTDRRPLSDVPVDDSALTAITVAVENERLGLHLLRRDQVIELAAAAGYAQKTERADPQWRAEVGQWTGGERPEGTGIPDDLIPDRPTQTTMPSRDFGHNGHLVITAQDDHCASFAVLHGLGDTPLAWLRAGEALSAAWLTASELGVSVLPMSAAVEVALTQEALRRILRRRDHPYIVLRLGIADPSHPATIRTPRLGLSDILDVD